VIFISDVTWSGRVFLSPLYFSISSSPICAAVIFCFLYCRPLFCFDLAIFFSGISYSVSFGWSQCYFWLFIVSLEVCPLFSFMVRGFKWCWRFLFPFSHLLAICLLITVDVLWRLWRICWRVELFYGVASNFVA